MKLGTTHHHIDGIFKMNKSSRKEGSVNPDKKSWYNGKRMTSLLTTELWSASLLVSFSFFFVPFLSFSFPFVELGCCWGPCARPRTEEPLQLMRKMTEKPLHRRCFCRGARYTTPAALNLEPHPQHVYLGAPRGVVGHEDRFSPLSCSFSNQTHAIQQHIFLMV